MDTNNMPEERKTTSTIIAASISFLSLALDNAGRALKRSPSCPHSLGLEPISFWQTAASPQMTSPTPTIRKPRSFCGWFGARALNRGDPTPRFGAPEAKSMRCLPAFLNVGYARKAVSPTDVQAGSSFYKMGPFENGYSLATSRRSRPHLLGRRGRLTKPVVRSSRICAVSRHRERLLFFLVPRRWTTI